MKNYYQIIVGLPKRPKLAKHPDTSIRRIKHEKPLSSFAQKMVTFRAFVFKKTGEFNINSNKISNKDRIILRQQALKYAHLK